MAALFALRSQKIMTLFCYFYTNTFNEGRQYPVNKRTIQYNLYNIIIGRVLLKKKLVIKDVNRLAWCIGKRQWNVDQR